MSVPIRKPLSRKFNTSFFEFGRSPDSRLATDLPMDQSPQWFRSCNKHPPKWRTKLTVAGTAPDLHRIPF